LRNNRNQKHQAGLSPREVQESSRRWWTESPMTYDWRGQNKYEPLSEQWFAAADAKLIDAVRLFATDRQPFDRVLPLAKLAGKRVLEIGCGIGLHCEIMARAAADVTAIDLSEPSVQATRRRLELKSLKARVLVADGERLPFAAREFDFLWSWGTIQYSSRTARIVREMARVLKPDGEARVMMYNRAGMAARVIFLKDHLAKLKFLRQSFDQSLCEAGDGFITRYYTQDQAEDLFCAHFAQVSSEICGFDSDVVPLPRQLRSAVLHCLPMDYLRKAQANRGNFLLLKASIPS